MLLRRRRSPALDDDDPNVLVEHGPSLAKGPALLVGSILVAFGLTGLLTNSIFPNFSSTFPNGTVQGSSWLGIEVNGWTNFFSIAAGALLLFGAAQHHLAKTMSLIVGALLGACAVIAIIDGSDVLGLAAANGWTKLGFAVAGAAMLLNALMPRTKRRRHLDDLRARAAATSARDRDAVRDREVVRDRDVEREPMAARDGDATAVRPATQPTAGTARFGRPAAEEDLAEVDATRTMPADRPGAVSSDAGDAPTRGR